MATFNVNENDLGSEVTNMSQYAPRSSHPETPSVPNSRHKRKRSPSNISRSITESRESDHESASSQPLRILHRNAPKAPPGSRFLLKDNLHIDTSPLVEGISADEKLLIQLKNTKGQWAEFEFVRRRGFDFSNSAHIANGNTWRIQLLRRTLSIFTDARNRWSASELASIKTHPSYAEDYMSNAALNQLKQQIPSRTRETIRHKAAQMKRDDDQDSAVKAKLEQISQHCSSNISSYASSLAETGNTNSVLSAVEFPEFPEAVNAEFQGGESRTNSDDGGLFSGHSIILAAGGTNASDQEHLFSENWEEDFFRTREGSDSEYPDPCNPDGEYWASIGYPRD